jgi:hypothetical protein
LQVTIVESLNHFSRCHHALGDTNTQFVGNQWSRLDRVEVVQFRPSLASNNENIFESFGCYKSCTRTTALQQCICANCSSVNYLKLIETETSLIADTS